ncbi:hypothetical protein [Streptomyces sp. NPDC059378]|uniref:hypothetical protein n=1 Tax=Streptomyces sp. NPDC059378 TaxID=3346815 RepID=UPI00369597E0
MKQRVVRHMGAPLEGYEIDACALRETGMRGLVMYRLVDGWMKFAVYDPAPDGDPLVWHLPGSREISASVSDL